jgi:omega-3 fatty acid desaturase (delta-15 desaturase)
MIGHDCGHESFSDSQFWSDIAGHLAMAPIQTPYWPMAKSHRQHHNFTNHMEKDKGYFWTTEEDYVHAGWFERNFSKIPLSNFLKWNLMHLFMGIPDGSLFWPYSKLFKNNVERLQCVISGFTCFFCIFVAFRMCNYSFIDTGKYYLMPVLFQGFWMVMLTTLQHQDEEAEVYEDGAWTYVKGQVQTIDRVYGLGVDWVLHHVTDCHVVHHFFTKIPHYHLVEANEAVRKVFDRYPGVYKRRHCYHYLIEFLRLNCVLEYLVRKENGLRKFNASVDFYGRAAFKAA